MITDWKGNEIKPGMEIVLINTFIRQYFTEVGIPPHDPIPCWDVYDPHIVELNEHGILGYWTHGKHTGEFEGYTYSIFNAVQGVFRSPDVLVAIKGVSDSKP